jgi:transposase-like protein
MMIDWVVRLYRIFLCAIGQLICIQCGSINITVIGWEDYHLRYRCNVCGEETLVLTV